MGSIPLNAFFFFSPKAMLNEVVTQTKLKHKLISKVKTQIKLTSHRPSQKHQHSGKSHAHRQKEGHNEHRTGGRAGWDMRPDILHQYTPEYITILLKLKKMCIDQFTDAVSVLNSRWSDCHRINVPQQNSMGTGQDSEHVGQRWMMSMSRPEDI